MPLRGRRGGRRGDLQPAAPVVLAGSGEEAAAFRADAQSMVVLQGTGNTQIIQLPARAPRVVPRPLRFAIPRKTRSFTARANVLADLDGGWPPITVNAAPAVQVLTGLPGVGKTQIAAAYVEAHVADYDLVAWIRAVDPATDLARLGDELGLSEPEDTIEQRAGHMMTALASWGGPWLLVLDNVDTATALDKWCPSTGPGRVLVTTRDRGLAEQVGRRCPVEVFTPTEAVEFLLRRSGREPSQPVQPDAADVDGEATVGEDAAQAARLALALGWLPLALAHAGAYCARSNGGPSFAEYQTRLRTLPAATLYTSAPDAFYTETVATTWAVSVAAATERSPLAPAVLGMAALLDPDAVPLDFFDVLTTNTHADAGIGAVGVETVGRHDRDVAVAALVDYSLADIVNGQFAMHRLLQKVIQDDLAATGNTDAAAHATTALAAAEPGDPAVPANWPAWVRLVGHVAVLTGQPDALLANSVSLTELCNSFVVYLLHAADALALSVLAPRALEICDVLLGPDHPATLTARANLAGSYRSAGRTSDAITLLEAVLTDSVRPLGAEHPATLTARANLAGSYWSAGRTSDAITLLEAVLTDSVRLLGAAHPDTLTARANLANLQKDQAVDGP